MYELIYMSQAQKDAKKLGSSGLKPKAVKLLDIIVPLANSITPNS